MTSWPAVSGTPHCRSSTFDAELAVVTVIFSDWLLDSYVVVSSVCVAAAPFWTWSVHEAVPFSNKLLESRSVVGSLAAYTLNSSTDHQSDVELPWSTTLTYWYVTGPPGKTTCEKLFVMVVVGRTTE